MSSFWSLYIVLLTGANIAAAWWLIRWTAKPRKGEVAATETTGHVWDENLTEYNKPMPRWWLYLFYLSIVFAVIYLILYPGLGNFRGLLGWTQVNAYEAQMAQAEQTYGPIFQKYGATDPIALSQDPEAMGTASRLFANNCAACHGSDARGGPGFPNLTDGDWLYGGSPETIRESILKGRSGLMPPLGAALGEEGIAEVAQYVLSLSGRPSNPVQAAAGQQKFAMLCAACHGPEGKGTPALGAPNLTDNIWLYGGSADTIAQTIRGGRQGRMPAHEALLGADRVHLLAAYVYGLSHRDESSKP
jgi:cytochrome c oxidase cbb3-type subunit 3